jgi:hypothetical protein
MFHIFNLFFVVVLVSTLSTLTVAENNNKVMIKAQRHAKLNNPGIIRGKGPDSSSAGSSSSKSEQKSLLKAATKPLITMKSAATAIKDEVVDIFDSIVYAESAGERLENTFDALRRHKVLLTVGATAFAIKSTIGGKRLDMNNNLEVNVRQVSLSVGPFNL